MSRVALTGPSLPLARRVRQSLTASDELITVESVDPAATDESLDAVARLVDDRAGALELQHGQCDVLVHLAWDRQDRADQSLNLAGLRRVLVMAESLNVKQVVFVSSAAVYGAWPDNPVPLSEDASVRPDPNWPPAIALAEAERVLAEYRDDNPSSAVCILRPAIVVGPDVDSWHDEALAGLQRLGTMAFDRPVQFVHPDDLASAVALAVTRRLDGVYNVAPDGWLADRQARALAGRTPVVELPDRVFRLAMPIARRAKWWLTPSGAERYVSSPWVVAADRLRGEGWSPTYTNEEAVVVSVRGSWWSEMSPRRRQEMLLAGSTLGIAALGLVGVSAIRRRRR
jgi:nucleoside-diphosphate-sugar epimerase